MLLGLLLALPYRGQTTSTNRMGVFQQPHRNNVNETILSIKIKKKSKTIQNSW